MGKHSRCGSSNPSPFLKRCVTEIIKPTLGKELLAIDAGSGNNRNLNYLSSQFRSVIGCDKHPVPPAIEIDLDFEILPVYADLVYCGYTLPFLKEGYMGWVVKELWNSVNPNGFLVIELFDAKSAVTPVETCRKVIKKHFETSGNAVQLYKRSKNHQLWFNPGGKALKGTISSTQIKK